MSRAFRCDALDTPQAYILKKNVSHKIVLWKFRANGHFRPKRALLGPPGTQKGPNTRSKCVVSMSPAQPDQSGAVGIKFGPPGPFEDLPGPQNGPFGPKRALLGPPGPQRGPDTRSKCVVTMSPAQTSQSGAVGTKSGPPGPSEDLRGPQKVGINHVIFFENLRHAFFVHSDTISAFISLGNRKSFFLFQIIMSIEI